MFKRTIELNVVKKNKKNCDENADEPVYTAQDYANMAQDAARKMAVTAVKVVGCYMLMDTTRKIVINRLSK